MRVNIIRRLAEILFGPLVIPRRLPSDAGGGLLVVSGKVGGLKYLFKRAHAWDVDLLNIDRLLIKKGDNVWDIGANVGLFSRSAAFATGAEGLVLSVEADIDAVQLLYRTAHIAQAGHASMTVVPVALSETVGFVKFAIAKRARAANSIMGFGSTQTGGTAEVRTLPSFTLDSLMDYFGAPDFLKIDVEGAELDVLSGGGRVLSRVRPVIYCEVSAQTRDEVSVLLTSHNYKLWDGEGFKGPHQEALTRCSHNTVAIPEEIIKDYLVQ